MANQILSPSFRFYQSANADAKSIKEDFLIRIQEFQIIMEDIRRNPMKGSVQHYLLLGRRGSGKSTLLKRIQVEIESDKKLSKNYIAINLAEEQANIYKLNDLWEEIIDEVEYRGVIIKRPEWGNNAQVYSRNLFNAIHTSIVNSGKKIILLLDNIDRIFENLQSDAALLREYLLNFDDIRIVGGSTKMTEHFWKYNKPFYEFFRVLELKPLTSDEIKTLLLFWAGKLKLPELNNFVEKRSGQLEMVRILTDGLPRTLQFFVTILLTRTEETGYEYLRLIMDHVTPLYQERLNNLPPAQRKIVLKMAFLWEASGAKEIADATYMDNKVISAQLKQLCDKGIAEKIETNTKNHLYRLAERFFNLWLIFTQGSPFEKRKAKCLTIFLENFYEAEELTSLAFSHLSMLKNGSMSPNKAALLTKAYAQSRYITSSMRDQLIRQTLELKGIDVELKEQLPFTTQTLWVKVEESIREKNWNTAIKTLDNFEQDDGLRELLLGYIHFNWKKFDDAERYFLESTEKGFLLGPKLLANLYEFQQKFELAIKYYLIALENGDIDSSYKLGNLYESNGNHDLAEKYYLNSIENGNSDAMNSIAILYEELNRIELAEEYYLKAIANNNADALNNLALLYIELKKPEKAEHYFLLSIDKGNQDSLYNLGNFYSENGKYEFAEKYYLLALEKKDTNALFGLGHLYEIQKKYDLAEKYYLLSIETNNSNAAIRLGLVYKEQKKYEVSEKYFQIALSNGNNEANYFLALLQEDLQKFELAEEYYLKAVQTNDPYAMFGLAALYEDQGKLDLAEEYYLKAVELNDTDSMFNVAVLYEEQKKFDQAEKYYLKAIENNDLDAMTWIASLYLDQGKIVLAEKYFTMAITNGSTDAIYGLGSLYESQDVFELAEENYLLAKEKEVPEALYGLANLYYNNNKNKTTALELINDYCSTHQNNELGANLRIAINLWNGEIKQAHEIFYSLMNETKFAYFETTLLHFLIHSQINFILNLFTNENYDDDFKERFKPIYYAASLLNKENESIKLKIPPELTEVVNDIISAVKKWQDIFYKNK